MQIDISSSCPIEDDGKLRHIPTGTIFEIKIDFQNNSMELPDDIDSEIVESLTSHQWDEFQGEQWLFVDGTQLLLCSNDNRDRIVTMQGGVTQEIALDIFSSCVYVEEIGFDQVLLDVESHMPYAKAFMRLYNNEAVQDDVIHRMPYVQSVLL